jgi:hypothetical protein
MRLDRLVIVMKIVCAVVALGILFAFKLPEKNLCENEMNYNMTTFQCHCPRRWLEIRANGLITKNPNKIPPCELFDRWIRYPIEMIIYA